MRLEAECSALRALISARSIMGIRRRETVHLGVLYSLTGPYGLVGREMLNGLTLAVEHVNTSADFDFQFSPLVFDPGGLSAG